MRLPWTRLQTQYDAAVPAQELNYYFKSVYIDRYDEELIAFLNEACVEFPTVQSHMLLVPFGGKMAEPGPEDTAFGRRDMQFVCEFDAIWSDPADEERCIAWVRQAAKDAERFSKGGGYLNVHALGDDEDALVRESLGAANYERLASIKHRYDPENVFRIGPSSIAPTAPVSAV
jgi:hypothetical protein